MKGPSYAILIAVTASAVLAGGCGGEPRRSAATSVAPQLPAKVTVPETRGSARVTDPGRAAFIRRADRVCAGLDPEREAALAQVATADDPAAAYDRTVALARDQLSRIEAIAPPAGDAQLITDNVIDRLRQRLLVRERLTEDLANDDAAGTSRDQAEYEALGVAIRSFARGYGFKECGAR